jgi:uncharacterized membrane protein YeaQ/YmgE (transglycosylase-associated protein family)
VEILAWLIVGLALLGLARVTRPSPDPYGLAPTMLIGIGGAVLGGVVASVVLPDADPGLHTLVLTTVGAIVTMGVYRLLRRGD